MIETAVILAAGRGSRLREVTASRSKAMVPVVGVPMVARVVASLEGAGVRRFVIVAAPNDLELVELFRRDSRFTLKIQVEPKGSADALRVCQGDLKGDFIVSSCDSLVSAESVGSLMRSHAQSGAAATLAIEDVDSGVSLAARSVVKLDGERVTRFIEKPGDGQRLSNSSALPLYCFSSAIFERLGRLACSPRGEFELAGAISLLIGDGLVVNGVKVSGRLDLTSIDDLLSINRYFLNRLEPGVQVDPLAVLGKGVSLIAPVRIDAHVNVGDGAVVGPEAYLERGAVIGQGVRVSRALVLKGARLFVDALDQVVMS